MDLNQPPPSNIQLTTVAIDLNQPPPKNIRLTNAQRERILMDLFQESKDGKLKKGSISRVAANYSLSTRTISRLWRQAKFGLNNGGIIDVSTNYGRAGRKRISFDISRVTEIPLRKRTNLSSMACHLKMAKSTLHRRVQEGLIKPHTNAIKPYLSEENKKLRVKFCLSMFESGTIPTNPTFIDMFNFVHIDEKWFYMSQNCQKYYLLPSETEPQRECKSKRFITKVMFMAAVARPRSNFSGKIGIFPLVKKEPAKKKSKNRAAGTLETKPILVTKDVIRDCLIQKVIPAIRAKWPEPGPTLVFIQLDNARPHNCVNEQFFESLSGDGLTFKPCFQPPNSPDLNVLDLGYFRAIQSLQQQNPPSSVDELIDVVERSFVDLSTESLNNVFLTLQMSMIEVLKAHGGNNYKVPHMGKKRLERLGLLPLQLQCPSDVVSEAIQHLQP